MYRLVAIVPMRHDSERVRGKNYRDFAGKPLFHHLVGALTGCESVDRVVIDTDTMAVDAEATEKLRAEMRARRNWTEVPKVLWEEWPGTEKAAE